MRAAILGLSPYVKDYWTANGQSLFQATGGNTGNLAFLFAVNNHITSRCAILPMSADPAIVREMADVVVLPLANQLGAHTDLGSQADQLEKIGLPIVGIGLGAQASNQGSHCDISPGTERWLRTVCAHSQNGKANIGLRGEFTLRQFERLGLADSGIVTGCPSNFISEGNSFTCEIEKKIQTPISRVAVCAGIQFVSDLSGIEQDLFDIVTATNGIYITQHAIDMINFARWDVEAMNTERLEQIRKYIAPHLSLSELKNWSRTHARCFADARQWMDELRYYDFAVGTRFHGAMLAIQAGIPAGCIVHDSRVEEMCQTMAIPYINHKDINGGITKSLLKKMFHFDVEQYKNTRAVLAEKYINLLVQNGLEPSYRLKSYNK
ncbi:hypothetical protein FV222_22485 [Methylobacterium sp. WL103]|uniref:polysaccharide pyruvyl transferase family protein n=1 Tax=Methylobacterium sp. WL103 TaxID=2603891 RepID=UPI0011CB8FB5|nr:polysaccharide pyruvyl transferase family protein [Methylobacterium sp. WL103]TXM93259.1 hypothetical protein FV222_22485 [Methylobacterium sp. WL103]